MSKKEEFFKNLYADNLDIEIKRQEEGKSQGFTREMYDKNFENLSEEIEKMDNELNLRPDDLLLNKKLNFLMSLERDLKNFYTEDRELIYKQARRNRIIKLSRLLQI